MNEHITPEVRQELLEMVKETLEDDYTGYICDLHNEVFNTDYFIIGNYEAEEWLKENYGVFLAIEKVREYEEYNFGQVSTDFSSPEKVCNMLAYILGEEIMSEIESINDNWDKLADEEIRQEILAELKGEED